MTIFFLYIIAIIIAILLIKFTTNKNNSQKGNDEFQIIDSTNGINENIASKSEKNPNCAIGRIIAIVCSLSVISGIGIIFRLLGIIYLSYQYRKGKYSPACWKGISFILLLPIIILGLLFGGCMIIALNWR